jgi:hypothetical protein
VTRLFQEYVEERVDPDDLADPDTPPEWVARLWQELELEVLNDSEDHDALSNAINAMSDFRPTDPDYSDFRITDAWEYASSLQQYTFHFIWRLYAIAHAIRAYDGAAGAAGRAPLPLPRSRRRARQRHQRLPRLRPAARRLECCRAQHRTPGARRMNSSDRLPVHYHVHLDVAGALTNFTDQDLVGLFQRNPPGEPLTAAEARRVLTDHLANGRHVIPLAPCEGFDYSGTGCPGHLAEAEADHG